MDFITLDYYKIFLPLVVILVLFIGRQRRDIQVLIMLAMSYIFFWLASGWHILLLLTSTIIDWTAGKKIHNSENKKVRKRWLIGSLTINLGILAIFKYLDFLIESFNFVSLRFTGAPEIDSFGLLLPVGISFYTFQTMSYTIDIYRKKHDPYARFIDFACYAAFFPQLVAGPIVRSQHFLEQIKSPVKCNSYRFRIGLTLIMYGLVKKLVIASLSILLIPLVVYYFLINPYQTDEFSCIQNSENLSAKLFINKFLLNTLEVTFSNQIFDQ